MPASTLVYGDRVRETWTGIGTGTISLAGAVSGFRTFVAGIGTGKRVQYAIVHQTANEWEVGEGIVTDAALDTLSRDRVIANHLGTTALVSFTGGTKDVIAGASGEALGMLLFADVRTYGATGDGTTDDTAAFNAALAANKRVMVPARRAAGAAATWKLASGVSFAQDGNELIGEGEGTVISGTGIGTIIDFNGKDYGVCERFKLITTTAAIGIDVGVIAHNYRVRGVHFDGQVSGTPTGFTTAGIQVEQSFYGEISHCDITYCAGAGIYGFRECNGFSWRGNSIRQCLTGIKLTSELGASDGGEIAGNIIESDRTGSLYALDFRGARAMMVSGNRIEYNVGTVHVRVINESTTVAQFNQFQGNLLEGTIAAYTFGDATGTNEVVSNMVFGGRAAGNIVINSDCLDTMIIAARSSYGGTLTDNGYGSTVMIDPTDKNKWYRRSWANNTGIGLAEEVGGTIATFQGSGGLDLAIGSVGVVWRCESTGLVRAPNGGIASVSVAPSEATLVAGVNAAGGNSFRTTLTAARVVGAPTNPTVGQRITFFLLQNATGGWAVTWNAVFKVSWSDTGNTANKRSSISFIYDGTNWVQDGAQSPYI